MKNQQITISGMTCGHCVMNVKKELTKMTGLTVKAVTIGAADIERDETMVSDQQLREAIEEAGYTVDSIK